MSFGSGAMTNSISEIKDCKLIFLIGGNPTEAHPIVGLEMKKALRKGCTFIVADPRQIWFAQHAKLYLPLKPGTDNWLLNAMAHVILAEGLENKEFIKTRTEGFEDLKAFVKDITPEKAAEFTGVPAEDIRQAARLYAKSEKSAIYYTLGITEHTCGTDNVRTIANLALLTGHVGRPSTGVNPIRGQNNVQGATDMCTPDKLPGYQLFSDQKAVEKFENAWGVTLNKKPGNTSPTMFERMHKSEFKALYVIGEDPIMSEPNQDYTIKGLKNLELLVIQDIFMSETAHYADVILPATSFAEKDGTFTNTERRVQRVRKGINPIGNTKPDWQITCELSTRMGYKMDYPSPKEVWDEISSLVPMLGGINYARIEQNGIQWPCPDIKHAGTKFLHEGKFPRGLGKFFVLPYRAPAESPDKEYPLLLSTGRTLYHYGAGTMTRRSAGIIHKTNDCFVEVNQADARELGISDGEMVRIASRRGKITARAEVSDKVKKGVIWIPMHFAEAAANKLTMDAYDNITQTAEYKVCGAKIEKL
jgi:formate dehydrogenase major subunit/formate dehydrogenase alpha subunit